MVNM
jgi:hypothetical protein